VKRTFLLNLALLVFLNLLIKPFWIFGIDRTVQNTVGTENYGLYASLFSLSIMLNILLDMGITNFNNKNIAQHNQLLQKYFSNAIVLKFFLGIVYFIIALIIGFFLGFSSHKFYLFSFLIFNQFLLSLILYVRSNISGLHMYKTDSIISVVDRSLLILFCGFLLLTRRDEFIIEWFIYAQTLSYSITFLISFFIVYRKINIFRIRFNYHFLIIILKQSYPYALLVLLMGLYTRMDMVMIETMLSDGALQAGIYAQAFRVLDAVSMFAFLFAGLLLPMFSKMIQQKESIAQLTKLSFLLIITPTLVFVIGTIFYGWELMKLMYTEHYDESTHIFKVLILGFIPIATSYIFGTLLTANNNIKQLNIVAGIGLTLNFTINMLLIPHYGGYGAAIASLATLSLTSISQIFIAKRVFSFHTHYPTILTLVAFTTSVVLAYSFLKGILENWIYNLVLIGIVCIFLAFATGLFRIRELIQILKKDMVED
jgi:O-antigen/teichoic acid export membrane protein